MFFPRFIKWLARLPAAYALGLLWWGEGTVVFFTLAGGYLLSAWLFEHIRVSLRILLFPAALLTFLVVFYVLHFTFVKVSQLMEALVHIHRLGGLGRVEHLLAPERKKELSAEQ